jgi:hypothetical protein
MPQPGWVKKQGGDMPEVESNNRQLNSGKTDWHRLRVSYLIEKSVSTIKIALYLGITYIALFTGPGGVIPCQG